MPRKSANARCAWCSRTKGSKLRELVETLDLHARKVGGITGSPLAVIAHGEWSPLWQNRLMEAVRALAGAADALMSAARLFREAVGLPDLALTRRARDGLAGLARSLPEPSGRPCRWR
jgi:hypothetical protein